MPRFYTMIPILLQFQWRGEFNSITVLKFSFDLGNDSCDFYHMKGIEKENKNLLNGIVCSRHIHVLKEDLTQMID